jgi:hypothetical protein
MIMYVVNSVKMLILILLRRRACRPATRSCSDRPAVTAFAHVVTPLATGVATSTGLAVI